MSRLSMLVEPSYSSVGSIPFRNTFVDPTVELDFPHRLFMPEHYEPGYKYPLVVWLHSDASSEMELDSVMPSLSMRNYVGISPRANIQVRGNQRRYRWGTSSTDCAVAEDLVWDCIRAAIAGLSINPECVFLAGFGGGATLAQWIGLKYARQIAGVVSLTGTFPKTPRVLSNWKQSRELNVLFTQRRGSTLCSEDELIRAVKTSHQSGLNYKFLRFESDSDSECDSNDLDSSMLAAANRYIMGIVTGTDVSLAPESTCDSEYVEFGVN